MSSQQRRFFRWAAANPKESGVPLSVSREFNESDPGGHLPKYVGKRQAGGDVGGGLGGTSTINPEDQVQTSGQVFSGAAHALGEDAMHLARGFWEAGPGTLQRAWEGQLPPGAPETEEAARTTAMTYGLPGGASGEALSAGVRGVWGRDLTGKWSGEKPRTFYRGTTPGRTERISTGNPEWDQHLFASSDPSKASSYGSNLQTFEAKPEAKILYAGTPEYNRLAKGLKGSLLDVSSGVASRAKAAGYDAVWFERQGDVGTTIFNPDAFVSQRPGTKLPAGSLGLPPTDDRQDTLTMAPEQHKAGGGVGLGARPRLQMGGMPSGADMPFWTRAEARSIEDQPHGGGLIAGSGAGRTDQYPLAVPVESHVIPAQEIAGLGQGNSMSGSRIMSAALSIGPWGIHPLPGVRGRGVGMPAPPRPYVDRGYATGGELDEGGAKHKNDTSILAAGGEFVVPREDWLQRDEHGQLNLHAGVRSIGSGDIAEGHRLLNEMIHRIRQHTIKFLRTAPPPKS